MPAFVCLIRGINVTGHHKVRMADLRSLLEGLGLEEPRTYIQSGNAVFRARGRPRAIADRIVQAFDATFGFAPRVLVLPPKAVSDAIASCPFAEEARADPRSVHLYFIEGRPDSGARESLASVESGRDRFALGEGVLYLHAPDGLGRSKLAQAVERKLRAPATARNWNTMRAILALLGPPDA